MSGNQQSKSDFLGMPFGTANQRLRKMIMFDFVKRLDLDSCFKCGSRIETIEELSIEHKLPWQDIDVDLFWSLDNIAFSHLRCNMPHRYNPANKKSVTDGYVWCYACQSELPISSFYSDASDGSRAKVASRCKECNRARRTSQRKSAKLMSL